MPQSSELAGGEGFTFEGDAAAFYLAALLAESYAPGIDNNTVHCVSVQQRDFGEPLDDVIVDFEDFSKNRSRLSLQIKRTLTISAAKSNTDFRDIIRDSWRTLNKPYFRRNFDRYGAAVGTVSTARARDLKTLCELARESLTAEHFDSRFASGGNASAQIRSVKTVIVNLLNEFNGAPSTSEEVHRFLAHFVLIQFDLLQEGASDPPEAISRIRDCLAPNEASKAPLVWAELVKLARSSAGKSGQFDRARLVRLISVVAQLRGAVSLRNDLEILTNLAKSYEDLIVDDVGGIKLERPSLFKSLDTKLTTTRVVQIRGLPGSGKSVVVKRAVKRALEWGPVIFLKAEQLEGTSWTSYAASQGLSGANLEHLLVEIGAVGTPTLFIDAIDRVVKVHQAIILDVIRTIAHSQLLDNWRIVVSLRDTGIEMLRNWLGEYLDVLHFDTLSVGLLSDEEAEALATAKPHLRPLLFGSTQVRDIVRRPFFAKVLDKGYLADTTTPAFAPRSEVDLIANWWQHGGYNETGQNATERQLLLLNLANARARKLSEPIRLSELNPTDHIDDLKSDGILQNIREGVTINFSHDIFFEWSYFYVLADYQDQWIDNIKDCGEPPALARVVELASQWEYTHGKNWSSYLAKSEDSGIRSQWIRAWLIGPLGSASFDADEGLFKTVVFEDDFRLFRKMLVWFQAEKTIPNRNIPVGMLPQEERQRFADLLGWPSDFSAWRRLIDFILRHIAYIPERLYPEIVTIFEVWQNALADFRNPTSLALLQQCSKWLVSEPDDNSVYYGRDSELGNFRKSIRHLILRVSRIEPIFASDYLKRLTNAERIKDDTFQDIIAFSPILSESLPKSLVELSLKFLRNELPDEQVARQEEDFFENDLHSISRQFLRGIGDFNEHDWAKLSLHDDHKIFSPESPLREPFHSLFKSSPNDALCLLRELCNHAMKSWQQLHRYPRERYFTPIPLELEFPWGTQRFWGNDREYLWCRSEWAPKAIGCGFMALEEWCFAELSRGRPVDELIQQIVEQNECIAILGTAAMIVLHTQTVSDVSFPIVTSQRLLSADRNRRKQDIALIANLIGFSPNSDKSHIEAIRAANARTVRKMELRGMVPMWMFSSELMRTRIREAFLDLKNKLPFHYEEQRNSPEAQEYYTSEALEYAELVELDNYKAHPVQDNPDQLAITHTSPSSEKPENIAKAEEASILIDLMGVRTWASKSLEEKELSNSYTLDAALAIARTAECSDLFAVLSDEEEKNNLDIRREAIAATAAIVLNFRKGRTDEDFEWARNVIGCAMRMPEKQGLMWSRDMVYTWHHAIYAARGLGGEFKEGSITPESARDLLSLVAHPLDVVSLAALEEACKLWPKDPKLTWAALILAFSLCHVPKDHRHQLNPDIEKLNFETDAQHALGAVFDFYENGTGWKPLPLPPPAWVKVQQHKGQYRHSSCEDYNEDEVIDSNEDWKEPHFFWYSKPLVSG
jgi:hypothetical protein